MQKIDENFAQCPQIRVEDIQGIADAGFKGIVCARPDNEDPDQPAFSEIAREAERLGLKAYHIPVSGRLTEGNLIRFEQAREDAGGPLLGYCRSGARAGSLYAAISRR
jgi:uncharacterized protein (TIGR01244 family)